MVNNVIDIYHFDTVTAFSDVKSAGIDGIIHKATQGISYVDPTFASRKTAAQTAGLLFGAYHFGDGSDPQEQAKHLVDTAGTDLLLVLDFEDPPPQTSPMSLQQAEDFVRQVHELTGRYPGLYSSNRIKECLEQANITNPKQTVLSECWLWIADYSDSPTIPSIWAQWSLWQYTDGKKGNPPHTVNGVTSCDRDQFNGSSSELKQFWQSNSG